MDLAGGNGNAQLFGWYTEMPLVSKTYLTAAVCVSTLCFLDVISPLSLYYNYDLVLNKGQYWRVLTTFLFFGSFSLDFLFHLYFVVRYCQSLEEGQFRGHTADFIFMLILTAFGMLVCVMSIDYFAKIKFLGSPLATMMVYVWARSPENVNVHLSLFGVFTFKAPYLPWMFLAFSLFVGNPIEADLLGILVGHTYYFLDFIFPRVAEIRGWQLRRIIVTPRILESLCGGNQIQVNEFQFENDHNN